MHSRPLEPFNNRKETFMNKLIASLIVGAFSAASFATTPAPAPTPAAVSATGTVTAAALAKADAKASGVKHKTATQKIEAAK
jgi:hypothetical protein